MPRLNVPTPISTVALRAALFMPLAWTQMGKSRFRSDGSPDCSPQSFTSQSTLAAGPRRFCNQSANGTSASPASRRAAETPGARSIAALSLRLWPRDAAGSARAAITADNAIKIFPGAARTLASSNRLAFLDHLLEHVFQAPAVHELLVAEKFDVVDDPPAAVLNQEHPVFPGELGAVSVVGVGQLDDARRRRFLHLALDDFIGDRALVRRGEQIALDPRRRRALGFPGRVLLHARGGVEKAGEAGGDEFFELRLLLSRRHAGRAHLHVDVVKRADGVFDLALVAGLPAGGRQQQRRRASDFPSGAER